MAVNSPNLTFRPGVVLLSSIFIASLITATLLASKLTYYAGFTFSIGLFFFPLTFITNEVGAEVYGKEFAKSLILSGIAAQLIMLVAVVAGDWMPGSPLRDVSGAYHQMFALAPRMISASIVAYLFAQLVDIESFLKMKIATGGRFLWFRSLVAILISQAIDTAIFSTLFLGGVIPTHDLVRSAALAYTIKVMIGFLDTPLLYAGVSLIRAVDRKAEAGAVAEASAKKLLSVPVRTPVFKTGEDLITFIARSVPHHLVQEGMVLAITSKIVSLAENAILKRDETPKRTIIEREADQFLGETVHQVYLTVKHGILIASAGIDESNSESGDYILFPKDPYASAAKIHQALREHWKLSRLGILITDSHTQPLRKGVTGIALSHAGFKATRDLVGEADLFGRKMRMTHVNVIDSLATAAVYEMGEVNESCPLAVVYSPGLEFTEVSYEQARTEIQIPMNEDLYGVLFTGDAGSREK